MDKKTLKRRWNPAQPHEGNSFIECTGNASAAISQKSLKINVYKKFHVIAARRKFAVCCRCDAKNQEAVDCAYREGIVVIKKHDQKINPIMVGEW